MKVKEFAKKNKVKLIVAGLGGVAIGLPIVLLNLTKANGVDAGISVSDIIQNTPVAKSGLSKETMADIDESIYTELAPNIFDCIVSETNHVIEQKYHLIEGLTKKVTVIIEND